MYLVCDGGGTKTDFPPDGVFGFTTRTVRMP